MKKLNEPFLIGKKVYLRLHNNSDIPLWYEWFNDQDVVRFSVHGCFPNTRARQLRFFRDMYCSKDSFQLAIVDIKNGVLIGTVGLHKIDLINRNADISIIVGNKKYWGKGNGRESVELVLKHAFDKLNLHKVSAGMAEDNIASFKLFNSLGFRQEGRLKEQNFANGKYQNIIKLGLLKKHWDRPKK